MSTNLNNFEKRGDNLYKHEGHYYRLFAKGQTLNSCWLIAPKMVELMDIDTATGEDVYGSAEWVFDAVGTVPASLAFRRYANA